MMSNEVAEVRIKLLSMTNKVYEGLYFKEREDVEKSRLKDTQ